jgi:hypothetical protein
MVSVDGLAIRPSLFFLLYDKYSHSTFHPVKVLTNSLYLVKVEIVILLLYQFSELKYMNDK